MSQLTLFTEHDIRRVSFALSAPSRLRILSLLRKDKLMITHIAERLNMTAANVSAQIKILEDAGLVEVEYKTGRRGLAKWCSCIVSMISIQLDGMR